MKSPCSPVKTSGSVRFAAPLLDAGGVELLGLLEPVALGIDLNDLGAVEEAVDEEDDAGGVAAMPFRDAPLRHRLMRHFSI